jgi:TolC family type I secretion outer membrane protein
MSRLLLKLSVLSLLVPVTAGAETLQDALSATYESNPQLQSARALLRATDEQVPLALSGYRPNVEATASAGAARTETSGTRTGTTPRGVGVSLTQPVYKGGRTSAGVDVAENQVLAQRATLMASEQSVLLDAVTAYLDTIKAKAVFDLNVNNEQVLTQQLKSSRDQFAVGQITRTDVSQAESRLARATADRVQAEGNLNTARSTYLRVIGHPAENLAEVEKLPPLPASKEELINKAIKENPSVIAANYLEVAARSSVDQAEGALLPEVNLTASATRDWESANPGVRGDDARIIGQMTIPLYKSGADYARIRSAKQTVSQRRQDSLDAIRRAQQSAVQAFENLAAARSTTTARIAQKDAADLALEGIRAESSVGTRTTLDVLNAEQELLDAEVGLVTARHAEAIATYQTLAAIGGLTAEGLGLSVTRYDPAAYYQQVRGKWLGVGVLGDK